MNETTTIIQTAKDDFIMLPTIDVCFAGLMENAKVRKGFCAAVLRVSPDTIRETELLPTHLRRNYAGDKLELQILELKKLPEDIKTGEDIVNWMRFFNGKSKEDFERMAKTSEYLGEAYDALQKLSADDIKRLEYETREKALKDYNTQMGSAEKRGIKKGIRLTKQVLSLHALGKSEQEIADECGSTVGEVREILE